MSGKRNVSVCKGHELANALYFTQRRRVYVVGNVQKKTDIKENTIMQTKGRQQMTLFEQN